MERKRSAKKDEEEEKTLSSRVDGVGLIRLVNSLPGGLLEFVERVWLRYWVWYEERFFSGCLSTF